MSAPPARDGGYGWVTVGAAFSTHVVTFGLVYSFTVFFPPILEEFGRGRGATAWVGSIAAAFMLGMGGVSGALTDRFGPRRVMTAGALLLGAGLIGSASASALWQVYLAFGVAVGVGGALSYIPAIGAVGQWFEQRRGLALGITVAGSGVGTLIMAPVAEALIDAYDWRVAVRWLGAGGLVLMLASAAVIRGAVIERATIGAFAMVRRSRAFWLLVFSSFVAAYGYWVPFVHIVPYAEDHGIATARAALLVAVMGAGNTIGRIVMGWLADKVGRLRMMQAATVGMTAAMFTWPAAESWATLAAFGGTYALFAGAFISTLPALTADYFGMERLAGITGMLFSAAAVGTLFGAPVSGLMFDTQGSYTTAILVAGGTMAVGAVLLLPLPQPGARRGSATLAGVAVGAVDRRPDA